MHARMCFEAFALKGKSCHHACWTRAALHSSTSIGDTTTDLLNSISNCVMVSDLHPNSCSESCSESSCQWQFKLKLWMLLLAKLVQWKFVFWKLHSAIQAGDLKACVRLSKSCSSEAQWSKVDVLKTQYSELSTFWKMEFWSYVVQTMQYMWYQ